MKHSHPPTHAILNATAVIQRFTPGTKYRIDHIVPRAKGGPDSFSNKILTTDEANAAKGDRTPWKWFHDDRTEEDWLAYKERVWHRASHLGFRKLRLLLSADAQDLVERYTPLAETAWIARLAQTVASLHFGWSNGNDREGNKRVITVSGGLTGRTRRKYFLNSLLGRDRELDVKISERLEALAQLRSSSLPREEQKIKARALRAELAELNAESEKKRDDSRHHALDAMVLSLLEGWVNDPNREEEFRFTLLGDNPTFPPERETDIGQLRHRIIALGAAAEKAGSVEERTRINHQILACRASLAGMRTERNVRAVREAFRREIDGDAAQGIKPILPFWLHYPKPHWAAARLRGVWLRVESDAAERATIDDFDKAFKQERLALVDFPYVENPVTEKPEYSPAHGLRWMAEIVTHKDYDAKAVRRTVIGFLKAKPTEAQWKEWCVSPEAPTGIKPKKGQPDKREFVVYKLEAKRTKRPQETPSDRASLYSIGIGSTEVPKFDLTHFEMQVARLVRRPERGADKPEIPLQPDTELQTKLRGLFPRLEEFYRQYPPDPGDKPRKEAKKAEWQARKDNAAKAWQEFIKETGLDRHKSVYLSTSAVSVTEHRYERAGLSTVVLTKAKRFDEAKAEKEVQSISDPWTRFQVREFLKRGPAPEQWREFCETFVQTTRDRLKEFLAVNPETAGEFINFYRQEAADSGRRDGSEKGFRNRIRAVHQVIGNPNNYVDVSKDGSGIYAEGGNRGYLMWKRVEPEGEDPEKVTFGAQPVRAFLRLGDAKQQLLSKPGTELLDERLWQTKMLLYLPNETQSGKKTVPVGHYFFGSISNGTQATLNPLAGGDVYDGISLRSLLEQGLKRVELEH